jgi:hypothetical protein
MRPQTTRSAAASLPAPAALPLPDSLTFPEWVKAGRQLAQISHCVAWALGDWLIYGQVRYGSRYRSALAATQLDYQTLRNYAWVARAVPPSRRRDTLSFQHHAEVASLSEAEQDLWLSRAEREHWSRNRLRRELSNGTAEPNLPAPVVVRIAVAAPREQRWRRAARASAQEMEEWLAHALDAAADAVLSQARRR